MHSEQPNQQTGGGAGLVMLLSPEGFDHHFGSLGEVLAARGSVAAAETLQPHAPLRVSDAMAASCGAIVHLEGVYARAIGVRRAASRAGTPLALLMDGVAEYANTFLNANAGPDFLRPAPADVVFCAGPHDRSVLRALGNRAIATGLPRLAAFQARMRESARTATPRGVLVATANNPSFTAGGRTRLLKMLDSIRVALARRGVPARWRIGRDLASELNVEVDISPLTESLAAVCSVMTTASTLAVEAMIAGKPTGLLHPHPWPLWLPSAWVHRGVHWEGASEDLDRMQRFSGVAAAANAAAAASIAKAARGARPHEPVSAGDLVDSLMTPSSESIALQNRFRDVLSRSDADSRVASACGAMARCRRVRPRCPSAESVRSVVVPSAPQKAPGVRRVVSCIESHASSVGGVASWSSRMETAFAGDASGGIEWWTLFIGPDVPPLTEGLSARPRACVCLVDPTEAPALQAHAVANAIRAIDADVIVPNYGSLAHAAAQHERARSRGRTRVVVVAHTNDDVYRGMLASHDSWDAAVAVSDACASWLIPLAGKRPVRTIVCGVPFGRVPTVPTSGPLRLAYVGRVVEKQKRVSDLLRLMAELDRIGVAYEFDLVGDGDALGAWQQGLRELGIRGVVRVHGARELAWVQRFWSRVDVNVIVSDAEGTSVAMLEAMSHGVIPCITAVDAGATAIVRDGANGITVRVGDMKAMAARLGELAVDRSLRRSMSVAASRTIAEQHLSIEACAQSWQLLLEEIRSAEPDADTSSDAAIRCVESSPTAGPLAESDAVRLLLEAGFVMSSSPRQGGDGIVVTPCSPHPGAAVIARNRDAGIATVVCPTQCGDAWTHFGEHFDQLVQQGCERIAVWVGRGVPRSVIEWLAARPKPFVGFVRNDAKLHSTLLGAPVISPEAALHQAADGVVLCTPPGDLQGLVATHVLRAAGVVSLPAYTDRDLVVRVDEIGRRVAEIRREGGQIVTTCDPGVLPGAIVVSRPGTTEAAPRCLVLRGDEADFGAFAQSLAWRQRGTLVCSLRFREAELSSPERYAAIVNGIEESSPFAIYGGGRHTERLLGHSSVRKPMFILDDRGDGSRCIEGVPVVSPQSVETCIPPVVILSSPMHEEQMWVRSQPWRASGINVVRLYGCEALATALA